MIVNDEVGRRWKKEVVAYFSVLSQICMQEHCGRD
jgi:hypothetical protein